MGYTTTFDGEFEIVPPLNGHEVSYLNKFARTRRMDRTKGPYFVDGGGDFGQGQDDDVVDYNRPPKGQPGLWCQWVPTENGSALVWDEDEKFYEPAEWLLYLIEHFLAPPRTQLSIRLDPQFEHFTFDHVLNGSVTAQGEDADDTWMLIVHNNRVGTRRGRVMYDEPVWLDPETITT